MALWAQYTGEGLTSTVIPDQSGNGRDLSNDNVQSVASPFPPGGVCMSFPNATAEAILGTAGNALPVPGTYCFNIKPAANTTSYFAAAWERSDLRAYNADPFTVLVANNYWLTGPVITLDTNHQVVLQFEADGTGRLFFDDMQTPYAETIGAVVDALGLYLGSDAAGNKYSGLLGNFTIYDEILDATQRATWAATGNAAAASPAETPYATGEQYRLTLTGSADATTDIVLPMTNINARLRSGSPSYLSVTLPYTTAIAAAISARQNGDLQLEHQAMLSDGSSVDTTICTVGLETVQTSRSTSSRSIVLTGHRQTTNSTPTSHSPTAISLQTGTTRKTAIVPAFDPAIAAGDDITVEGVTFTVGTLVLQASPAFVQTQYVEG